MVRIACIMPSRSKRWGAPGAVVRIIVARRRCASLIMSIASLTPVHGKSRKFQDSEVYAASSQGMNAMFPIARGQGASVGGFRRVVRGAVERQVTSHLQRDGAVAQSQPASPHDHQEYRVCAGHMHAPGSYPHL